jgi:hypothetical protein
MVCTSNEPYLPTVTPINAAVTSCATAGIRNFMVLLRLSCCTLERHNNRAFSCSNAPDKGKSYRSLWTPLSSARFEVRLGVVGGSRQETQGRHIAETFMCLFGIVAVTPFHGDRPDLFQGGKDPGIKHLLADGAVEALDVGILVRLAGFDEGEDDPSRHAPRPQGLGDEFRPVVAPQLARYAMTGHEVVEQLDHLGTG